MSSPTSSSFTRRCGFASEFSASQNTIIVSAHLLDSQGHLTLPSQFELVRPTKGIRRSINNQYCIQTDRTSRPLFTASSFLAIVALDRNQSTVQTRNMYQLVPEARPLAASTPPGIFSETQYHEWKKTIYLVLSLQCVNITVQFWILFADFPKLTKKIARATNDNVLNKKLHYLELLRFETKSPDIELVL